MYKTFLVAWREFLSTVLTKGFIFGILLTPVMILIVGGGIALTQFLKGPTLAGRVAIIDRTGLVASGVSAKFSKDAIEKEVRDIKEKARKAVEGMTGAMGTDAPAQAQTAMSFADKQLENQIRAIETIEVEVLAAPVDQKAFDDLLEKEKAALAGVDIRAAREAGESPRVMVAVIDDKVLKADADGGYGTYLIYTANRLDPEIRGRIESKIDSSIVDARVAMDPSAKAGSLTAEKIRKLLASPKSEAKAVTATGEKSSGGGLQMMLPMAFMLLLLMSVMTGGQYLLTTTIEEKSSRVMEVLLSAVSPMQLMVGKILGQMCVGLLILTLYGGIGIASLVIFSLQHLLNPMTVVYLFVFFFIAFFVIASMMAAVGSAVSELREAQTLMTPVMMLMMIPWLLWLPISRSPSSTFSTVMSFVPGVNPFVMMIRLSSSEPPPTWQTLLAILVGLVTVLICCYAAAKIFRIGVLMYGKPPNWRTLVKWVRMA